MASKVYYRVQVIMYDLQRVHLKVVCYGVQLISIGGTWVDVVTMAQPVLW